MPWLTRNIFNQKCLLLLILYEGCRKLLLLFIKNRFRTVTKEEIASALSIFNLVSDSAIKKLILRLRKKLDTDIITSVRGVGYRLDIKKTKAISKPLKSV